MLRCGCFSVLYAGWRLYIYLGCDSEGVVRERSTGGGHCIGVGPSGSLLGTDRVFKGVECDGVLPSRVIEWRRVICGWLSR